MIVGSGEGNAGSRRYMRNKCQLAPAGVALVLVLVASCVSYYPRQPLSRVHLVRLARRSCRAADLKRSLARHFEPPEGMSVRLLMAQRYRPGTYRPVVQVGMGRARVMAELRTAFTISVVDYGCGLKNELYLLVGEGDTLTGRVNKLRALSTPEAPRAILAIVRVMRLERMRLYDSLLGVLDSRNGMAGFPRQFRPSAGMVLGYDFVRSFNHVVLDPRMGTVTLSAGEIKLPALERLVAALSLLGDSAPVTVGIVDRRRQVQVILDTGGDYELLAASSLFSEALFRNRALKRRVSLDLGGFVIPRLQLLAASPEELEGCEAVFLGGRVLMQYRVAFDMERGKVYLQFP